MQSVSAGTKRLGDIDNVSIKRNLDASLNSAAAHTHATAERNIDHLTQEKACECASVCLAEWTLAMAIQELYALDAPNTLQAIRKNGSSACNKWH